MSAISVYATITETGPGHVKVSATSPAATFAAIGRDNLDIDALGWDLDAVAAWFAAFASASHYDRVVGRCHGWVVEFRTEPHQPLVAVIRFDFDRP